VFALADQCPHRGTPLAIGCVTEDGFLECADHGWQYALATGEGRCGYEGTVERFAVRDDAGEIFVQEKEPREDWPADWFPPPPVFDDDEDSD
jgi:nitrite reductase (NADH) small subunit